VQSPQFRPLGDFLNQLTDRFHRSDFLGSDPLEFVHRYELAEDQELVALVAALLAYGNVKQIRASVAEALARVSRSGLRVSQFADSLLTDEGWEQGRKLFRGYVHRFNRGADLLWLLRLAGESRAQFGSVGAHFLSHLEPSHTTIERALNGLIAEWRAWAGPRVLRTSFSYLLTSPEQGSCCKRWCMFLRWMGRSDRLDPGLWTESSPLRASFPPGRFLSSSQLILPLDTHTGRISQYLGLTQRKSVNWLAAVEATETLRKVDERDPTRFDFALSRLGILNLCKKTYRPEICEKCELLPVCKFARAKRS
jgi:uncharacterized protein (TIGR02757 family)